MKGFKILDIPTPINVQNYIYETLLMYIFLIRNNPEIEFNKKSKELLKIFMSL